MTDLELVELMMRYDELKEEYEQFLCSDICKRIEANGNNTPSLWRWVKKFKDYDNNGDILPDGYKRLKDGTVAETNSWQYDKENDRVICPNCKAERFDFHYGSYCANCGFKIER